MANFIYASSQAAFSFVLSGRLAGDLFAKDWRACGDDKAKQNALIEETRIACIAGLLAKRQFKATLSAKDMTCAETLRVAAIKLREATKAEREKDGVQVIYKQANQKVMLIKEAAGLKDASASRGARTKDTAKVDNAPATPQNDDDAIKAALNKYRPDTFEKVERVALITGKMFGFAVNKPAPFEKSETPNRAKAIREAMAAFAKAMRELPTD